MNKKILISILLILISVPLLNATGKKKILNANSIEKNSVKISDNFYAGKFEVSNWLYRQFLIDLAASRRAADLKVAQIDSAGWLVKPMHIESFVTLYHNDPKFDEYPVVNISYEAANLFCEWLTKKYNSFPDKEFKEVKFILPGEQDWILAAKGGKEISIYSSGTSLKSDKGMFMCNYHQDRRAATANDPGISADILAPVNSYWENGLGICNMSGNASEMLSSKGITKGGSFMTTEGALKIEAKGHYEKPACDIGFRYFMKVIK